MERPVECGGGVSGGALVVVVVVVVGADREEWAVRMRLGVALYPVALMMAVRVWIWVCTSVWYALSGNGTAGVVEVEWWAGDRAWEWWVRAWCALS